MNTISLYSYGRRVQLLKFLKQSLGDDRRITYADNSPIASALYVADKHHVAPCIIDEHYIDTILQICKENNVQITTTLIDPEVELPSKNRDPLLQHGILPLCPERKTVTYCFDKFEFYKYLTSKGIRTVLAYDSVTSFEEGLKKGDTSFPILIKSMSGGGSVGIHEAQSLEELQEYLDEGEFTYITQEFTDHDDYDVDAYIDTISHEPVAVFPKRKLETKIGGASKTIPSKDERLFDFVRETCKVLEFNGPVDMDFWYRDSEYYFSEVNSRFGGAYLHAHGVGADFFKLIVNNMKGARNQSIVGQYNEDALMTMYDRVVTVGKKDLVREKI